MNVNRFAMAAVGMDFMNEVNRLNGLLMSLDYDPIPEKEKTKEGEAEPLASGWDFFKQNPTGSTI